MASTITATYPCPPDFINVLLIQYEGGPNPSFPNFANDTGGGTIVISDSNGTDIFTGYRLNLGTSPTTLTISPSSGVPGYIKVTDSSGNIQCQNIVADGFPHAMVFTNIATDNSKPFPIKIEAVGGACPLIHPTEDAELQLTFDGFDKNLYSIQINGNTIYPNTGSYPITGASTYTFNIPASYINVGANNYIQYYIDNLASDGYITTNDSIFTSQCDTLGVGANGIGVFNQTITDFVYVNVRNNGVCS